MSKKSKKEVNKLLKNEIAKALLVGVELNKISPKVRYSDSTTTYGCCTTYGSGSCVITLSKWMRKHPKTEISAVLMHEVLHATKGSHGHDSVWRDSILKVKQAYDYKGYEDCHLCEHPYSKKRPAPQKRATKKQK